jgi:hypothetical protein
MKRDSKREITMYCPQKKRIRHYLLERLYNQHEAVRKRGTGDKKIAVITKYATSNTHDTGAPNVKLQLISQTKSKEH